MKTSLNKIKKELRELAEAHLQINTFWWGDLFRAVNESNVQYPLMCAYENTGLFLNNQSNLTLIIEVFDMHYKDWNIDLDEVESDTLQITRDIFNVMNKSPRWQKLGRVESTTVEYMKSHSEDELAGHRMTINFVLRDSSGYCGLPVVGYDFDAVVGSVCEEVIIINSDLTYSQTLQAGDVFQLPDTTFNIYLDGNLETTVSLPTLGSDALTINL